MRKRNIKVNVFLNEKEKQMLMKKSNRVKLSQSDYIRNLIEQSSDLQLNKDEVNDIVILLSKIIDNLSFLKRQMDFLRYSDYSNVITNQINHINKIVSQIKK